jgi:hypothetical protein
MNILVGVISHSAAWVIPRAFVERIRSDFPHHAFLEAWDIDTIRQLLPEADAAFTPYVDRDIFPSLSRLRWIQAPAVGVGSLLFPEMIASAVTLTTARGIRARAMAEHVLGMSIALARQFHVAMRHQAKHEWVQDLLEGGGTSAIRTLEGARMGIVGLGAIGTEVARLAAPFGLRVSAIRRQANRPGPTGGGAVDAGEGVDVDELLPPDCLPDLNTGHSSSTSAGGSSSWTRPSWRDCAADSSAAQRSMSSHTNRSAPKARTGIFRTSSSRRTRPARCRTTGRRSSRSSPTIFAVSNRAGRS